VDWTAELFRDMLSLYVIPSPKKGLAYIFLDRPHYRFANKVMWTETAPA
jgi:hypothetical protein